VARILIIEDSLSVRVALRNILEPLGHEVVDAVSGQDALDKLAISHDFDVIITDINMPDMDGLTFIQHQKDHEIYSQIPTIMCTTEPDPNVAEEAKKLGIIKAWITKPVRSEVLITFVNRLIKK
tara:strand:- start:249 stop:620 length:372 start_codon:yes stop_codon:yes gene_type:complete